MTGLQVIFDTNCVLCSGVVRTVLQRERDDEITFINAWSDTGLTIAGAHGLTREDLDKTMLAVRGDDSFTKSDAAFEIMKHLRAPWRWGRIFRFVPRFIRDAVYSLVARNRYRWFSQEEFCLNIPPEQRRRFIDVPMQ